MTNAARPAEFDANGEETFVPALGDTHSSRARMILKAHPEIRALAGHNPWTMVITLACVATQLGIAALFGTMGLGWWWLALIAAYGFGAFVNHALYVVIHDATHDLVFRNRAANRLVLLIADIPALVPGGFSFRALHLTHHSHLGWMAHDADIPFAWEARLVGHSSWRKALWLFCFPILQVLRTARTGRAVKFDGWMAANAVVNLGVAALLAWLTGWNAVLYLFCSFWFALSLHPLGARWVQEHFTGDERHDTGGYYGPLNIPALNIGYHNEHHDFPWIPWNRLPQVTRIAGEFYRDLPRHRSWTGLFFRFILDPRYSLHARTVRPERSA